MARRPRDFEAGIYHIAAHGSDTRSLFLNVEDRIDFLERLTLSFSPLEITVLEYVLMSNHYHALVSIPDERLSKGLQLLHTNYSLHHNLRQRRSAHLFRAHCVANRITTNEQLLNASRYIARNPVEAQLVLHPLDWQWGSARAHTGMETPSISLDDKPLREAFDNDRNWRVRYRRNIERS